VGQIIRTLLNTIEDYTAENNNLKTELQRAKDENRRLKGEKGKPDIKPSKEATTHEENKPEKQSKKRRLFGRKSKKKDKIKITRTKSVVVDRDQLPEDAEYKGKRTVVIQDIKIDLDNIQFEIERFYSRSLKQAIEGKIPAEYQGSEFGPGIRSLVLLLHYQARVPQKLLRQILTGMGILISCGEIKEILLSVKNQPFHDEKDRVHQAAMETSPYQQIDDTGARMDGENIYTIVTCNEEFCSFTTSLKKDRLSALQALMGGKALRFMLNQEALDYMNNKISNKKLIEALKGICFDTVYGQPEFESQILDLPIVQKATETWKKYIIEGAAIAFYRSMAPSSLQSLICDDAPQFKDILENLGLCWVHEGRHYKDLMPRYQEFRGILDDFMDEFWKFYDELKKYKQRPTNRLRKKLDKRFDTLFTPDTDYYALNTIIKKTRSKKESLLLVLKYPEIPLHNNAAEQDIREKVIQRKIRNCFRSWRGAYASDTFLSLMATCRKQGISFWEYIKDRVYQTNQIPPLDQMIRQKLPLAA
jgi:hypothetical protein